MDRRFFLKPINEMDYLYASGRIRALEGQLLNREKTQRMIDARSMEDAVRVLADCGYEPDRLSTLEELDQILEIERMNTFDSLDAIIPDRRFVDFFRIRYDSHNIRVLLKNPASSEGSTRLLSSCGRIKPDPLTAIMREMDLRELQPLMRSAVEDAQEILARTGDPQLMDILLDKACLREMLQMAIETGSHFLTGYARLMIDTCNLRILIRTKRMGKDRSLLTHALIPGGGLSLNQLIGDALETVVESLYGNSLLKTAAHAGLMALRANTPMTELDLRCDNALTVYLRPAKTMAFGSPLVAAYLAAKESEITALRTILSGRMAGLPPESIRERIRDHYV